MNIVKTISEYRKCLVNIQTKGKSLGFVPTMGALHEGHLSLVKKAKMKSDVVVMSIFVNPTQFAPSEDLSSYPRPILEDQDKAKASGVDILFLPSELEIYGESPSVFVDENQISKNLCGEHRKGHFQGVCTVVLKLLNIIKPKHMFMGKKDAQQLRLIEKMTEDLQLETEIIGCETVREGSGLAMSSRNQYLSDSEKNSAAFIFKGLSKAKELFQQGEKIGPLICKAAKEVIESQASARIQYLKVVRWSDFSDVDRVEEKCILATAVYIGTTRLIDNVFLTPKT